MRTHVALVVMPLLAAAGCGGPPPHSEEAPGPAVVVNLKAVTSDSAPARQYASLDAEGKGEIPFANEAGKLLVSVTSRQEPPDAKRTAASVTVRLDTNGDGVIDDRDAPVKVGEPVKVRWLGGAAPEYPIRVAAAQKHYVMLESCLILEGTLDGCTIRLIDADVDGTFWRTGKDTLLVVEPKKAGAEDEDGASPLPFGRILAVKDRLYEVSCSEGGTRLTCRPHSGETAVLAAKAGDSVMSFSLQLAHENGLQYVSLSSRNPVRMVPGRYRITQSTLELSRNPVKPKAADDGNPTLFRWVGNLMRGELFTGEPDPDTLNLWGNYDEAAPVLTVRPGPQEVAPGPPFRLAFDAARSGPDGAEIGEPRLVGSAGEWYRPDVSGTGKEKSTLTSHVRAGGREEKLSDLGFG
jgi:hypothetical protein